MAFCTQGRDQSRVPARVAKAAGVVAATLLALSLAACSTTRAPSGQSSAGTSHTPVEAVLLAAQRGIADRSARFTMSMSAGSALAFQESGTGAIDFTNDSAQMDMSVSVLSEKIHVTAVVVAGAVYEDLSGLPGFKGLLKPGKSWIEIPVQGSLSESDGLGATGNPASFLLALTRKGLKVTSIGTSRVDGVSVTGYEVKFPENLATLGPGVGSLPSAAQQILRGITMHVWIDGSGLLRRMTMSLSSPAASSGIGTIKLTMDLSDYGTPVKVTAPPSSEVENFKSMTGRLGSSSSVTGGASGSSTS